MGTCPGTSRSSSSATASTATPGTRRCACCGSPTARRSATSGTARARVWSRSPSPPSPAIRGCWSQHERDGVRRCSSGTRRPAPSGGWTWTCRARSGADWWPDARSVLVSHVPPRARPRSPGWTWRPLRRSGSGRHRHGAARCTCAPDGDGLGVLVVGRQPPAIRGWTSGGRTACWCAARAPAAPPSVPVEDVWVDGPGGRVHALLRRPASGERRPVPTGRRACTAGRRATTRTPSAPYPSAWVDHGFAVVQVNYRGSTGYGSAWRDALEGRVGHVELEDVARRARPAGRRSGVADPTASCWPAGPGAATSRCSGSGTQPGAWARRASAGVPVADYVAAYEDEMEGLQGVRPVAVRRLAGPRSRSATPTPARSPTSTRSAPRCWCWPARTTRAARSGRSRTTWRAAERGVPHQVYRYDAGHGSMVDDERVRQMKVELDFVAEHLRR